MQKPGRRSLLSVVNEKVLKASDQRDIIWLLFEETLAKVLRACKKNFLFYWRNRCSTGRSCSRADQRLTRVSFSFVKKLLFG